MLKSKAAPNAEHQDERDDPAGAGIGLFQPSVQPR